MTNQHIQMPAVEPLIRYTAIGVQSFYEFPFPIFTNDDLKIFFDGVLQVQEYLISGAGNTLGGSVQFDTPPSLGIVITIMREIPYERVTDFLESGDFSEQSLNNELDYLTASVQQLYRDQRGMLRFSMSENQPNSILPSLPIRKNKALGFDAQGNPIAVDYGLTQSPSTFVAQGNGAISRSITDKVSDMISVRDYGAVGDGVHDDSLNIAKALQESNCVYIPTGIYRITQTINISSNKKIMGAGQSSVLKADTNLFKAISIRGGYNILSDFVIDGGDNGIIISGQDAPAVQNRIHNLVIKNSEIGVVLDGGDDTNKPCYWNNFQNCLIISPAEHGIFLTKSGIGDAPNANIFDGCRVYSNGESIIGHGAYIKDGSFYNRFVNCEINVHGTAQSCLTIGQNANQTIIDNLYCESYDFVPNIVLKTGSQNSFISNLLAMSNGAAILDESGGSYQSLNAGYPIQNKIQKANIADLTTTLLRQDTVYIDAPSVANIPLNSERSVHLVAATNGAITIQLPLASSLTGATFTIKKIDFTGNEVKISENIGLGIDRKTDIILGGPYDYVAIISNGAEWFITSSNRMAGNTKYYDTTGQLDIDMSVDTYLISSYGGAVTCRLPPANAARSIGRTITIKKTDNSPNPVYITEQGGNGPDQYTQPLSSQYKAITVVSNGGQWYIISKF